MIFLQIIIGLLVLQEIYKFCLYNFKLKKFDFFKSKNVYNEEIEKYYNDSLFLKNDEDFGVYYDNIAYDFFEINTTHNASIFQRSFFQESPYLYDYNEANISDKDIILDCGCGTGSFSVYIAKKNPNIKIVSISNSKKCIDITNKKIKQNNLEDRIETHLLNFDTIEEFFKDKKFNKIFFLESHGYSKNRNKLFESCYNLLIKGGLIYIRTPVFYDTQNNYFKDIINYWRYNFSTTNNICSDLEKVNFKNIQFMEVSTIQLFLSYDIFILTKLFIFMLSNSNLFSNIGKFFLHIYVVHKGIMFSVIKGYK